MPERTPGGLDGLQRAQARGQVLRKDYVPKGPDADLLTRDAAGRPNLCLQHVVDRLVIVSLAQPAALINPKSRSLHMLGLFVSCTRGEIFYAAAARAADLRPGAWVELRREPTNLYDRNAVALHAPGIERRFGYVQREKARAVARLMDSGTDVAAISMRGPGPEPAPPAPLEADAEYLGSAFVLIGSRADLVHMAPAGAHGKST